MTADTESASASASAPAAPAAKSVDTDASAPEILALERRVWDALVAGEAALDAALLAPDFLGLYPSGFAGRADHVGQLDDGPSIAGYGLSEVQVRSLAPGVALIAYRAAFTRVATPAREEEMLVASIWERRGDGWENVFSQDTPLGRADDRR